MSEQVKEVFKEYYEGAKGKAELITSITFVSEGVKTALEGWHSVGSFVLGLNWVFGWVCVCLMAAPLILMSPFIMLMFIPAIIGMAFDIYSYWGIRIISVLAVVGGIIQIVALFSELGRRYMNYMLGKVSPYISRFFVFGTVIGVALSVLVPMEKTDISFIRIMGWIAMVSGPSVIYKHLTGKL